MAQLLPDCPFASAMETIFFARPALAKIFGHHLGSPSSKHCWLPRGSLTPLQTPEPAGLMSHRERDREKKGRLGQLEAQTARLSQQHSHSSLDHQNEPLTSVGLLDNWIHCFHADSHQTIWRPPSSFLLQPCLRSCRCVRCEEQICTTDTIHQSTCSSWEHIQMPSYQVLLASVNDGRLA